jgi:hypothetical protein
MAKNDIIDELVAAAPNRRGLLRKLGIASVAVAAGAASGGKLKAASGPAASDVVQFALNLEYLEAEFYSVATTGKTLEQRGYNFSGSGKAGKTTTAFGKVNFTHEQLYLSSVADDIASDELAHVLLLRTALQGTGYAPIAKPAINLDALAPKGASLENDYSFLILARIFEDIGVTAYAGGAPYLVGSPYLQTAARILATEGQHSANLRLQLSFFGIKSPQLDGADVVPPAAGSNFFSTNTANGLVAIRTPGEVLYLAYGGASNATEGGFFPSGVNGVVNQASSGPATAADLN